MVLIALTFLLIIFEIYFLYRFKKITSPTVLLTAVFIVGALFAFIGNVEWKVNMNPLVLVVILLGVIAMAAGEIMAQRVKFSPINICEISYDGSRVQIFKWVHFLNLVLLIICLLLYVREQIDLAYAVGYGGNNLFRWIRYGHHFGYVDNTTLIKVCMSYMTAVNYIYLFIFVYNIFYAKQKKLVNSIVYLIPLPFYIVYQVFTSARSGFILLAVFLFISSVLLIDKKQNVSIFKFIKWAIVLIVAFFIVFSLLGYLTDKTTDSNIFENIKIYTGSSIVALSEYLDEMKYYNGGEESFVGFINFFKELFGHDTLSFSLEYVYFANGSSTNIYTAFRSYLNDFSYIGLIIIQFIIGFIFGYWHKSINFSSNLKPLSVMLYSYYMYFVVIALFTPTLTSGFLTVGRIFDLIMFIILFKLLNCFRYDKITNQQRLKIFTAI